MNIDLLTAPFGEGAGVLGAERGPGQLIEAGLLRALERHTVSIREVCAYHGVQPYLPRPNLKTAGHTRSYADSIYTDCINSLQAGRFPLLLAGDHSLSIGSIVAAAKNARDLGKKFVCLYVDAHADFNTPETTPTGNTHGMTIAAAAGMIHELQVTLTEDRFDLQDLIYYGLRDIDPGEAELLMSNANICAVTAEEARTNPARIFDLLASRVDADTHVHLSFDVDSLTPDEFTATGLNVPQGLTLQNVAELFDELARMRVVKSMDVVEYNPLKDDAYLTDGRKIVSLITTMFAR